MNRVGFETKFGQDSPRQGPQAGFKSASLSLAVDPTFPDERKRVSKTESQGPVTPRRSNATFDTRFCTMRLREKVAFCFT